MAEAGYLKYNNGTYKQAGILYNVGLHNKQHDVIFEQSFNWMVFDQFFSSGEEKYSCQTVGVTVVRALLFTTNRKYLELFN